MIELPREAIGFHGTSRDAVAHLLARDIRPSDQHLEWLGTGFYLWQDSPWRARQWGPPTYPATVVDHDLVPGGTVTYFMTGPEGDRYHGWWRVTAVDAPHRLEVEDGFADETGTPNPDLPVTTMHVVLAEEDGVTQVVTTSTFPSSEAMAQLADMGMEEGLREAMAQMDAVVAA